MTGVAVLRRRGKRDRSSIYRHITKAEHAQAFRAIATSLAKYADQPEAAAQALDALDYADRLETDWPRSGWYPSRPKGWKP